MWQRYNKRSPLLFCLLALQLSACSGPITKVEKPKPYSAEVETAYAGALAAMKAGKDKLALSQFEQLAGRYPSLSGVHTNLGMLYLKTKQLLQAEQSLTRSIALNPKNPVSYNYLGIVYRHLGRFDDAQSNYLQALTINEQYAFAHLNLGILYDLYLFDLQAALRHYLRYQTITANQDKLVEKWIVDIKRRDTANKQQGDNKG